MKFLRLIMSLFRKRAGRYEVWDTSALSNHFTTFIKMLQSDDMVRIVIPEGVSHEISVGRRNNEHCKDIYRFIEGNVRNPNLILAVTNDSIRTWTVDEQVIYTTSHYYNMGYDVTLVTCDRDQSFRARLKKLPVRLMPVVKSKQETNEDVTSINVEKVPVVVPMEIVKSENDAEEADVKKEIELPAKMVGKQCWLTFNKSVSVYDTRGKRKISRPNGTIVVCGDTIEYNDMRYIIKKIKANAVTAELSNAAR